MINPRRDFSFNLLAVRLYGQPRILGTGLSKPGSPQSGTKRCVMLHVHVLMLCVDLRVKPSCCALF